MKLASDDETAWAELKQLVETGEPETFHLDFKQKRYSAKSELDKEDRRSLGEALSGFANADGGTLIIGIATKTIDGEDRASEVTPLTKLAATASRVTAYLEECVNPVVDGAVVRAIPSNAKDEGVLVLTVPRGTARPHMSMAPSHQRFYRRVATSFMPMQRYEVEEMFRLRAAPKLKLSAKPASGGSYSGNQKSFIVIHLENLSDTTAKFPFVSVRVTSSGPTLSDFGVDGNGTHILKKYIPAVDGAVTFAGGNDVALHPKQTVAVMRFEYIERRSDRLPFFAAEDLPRDRPAIYDFSFGCEGALTQTVRLSLSQYDLFDRHVPEFENVEMLT